jgi:hypothetical protein
MINSVRNTVLAVANKQNFGYISPNDFNLYAKQAQIDIFEDYFYRYNEWINKQNSRVSGSGYADIVKNLEEVVDTFSSLDTPSGVSAPDFTLPLDYYLINSIRYSNKEVERVSQSKIINLISSNLTTPTTTFPAYVMNGSVFTVYPSTISTGITVQYIRKPLDPKWTYVVVPGTGEPTFDQSAVDYQDFELPSTDEPNLVNRILQYAGMSIREIPLVQFGRTEEQLETQKQG